MLKLSLVFLKKDKVRTIITFFAVILLSTLLSSEILLFNHIQLSKERNQLMFAGGDGQLEVTGMSIESQEHLHKDPRVKIIGKDTRIKDNVEMSNLSIIRPELHIMNDSMLDLKFIKLEEGTLPNRRNEIALDSLVLSILEVPKKVNQELTIDIIEDGIVKSETFVLSGWWEHQYEIPMTYLLVSEQWISNEEHKDSEQMTRLLLNDTKDLQDIVQLLEQLGIEEDSISINPVYLEKTSGAGVGTMIGMVLLFVFICAMGFLLVFNMYQVSFLQDRQFYGTLNLIGVTKKQLKTMLYCQSTIYGLLGVPVGLFIGFNIIERVSSVVTESLGMQNVSEVSLNISIISLVTLFSFITIYLSAFRALRSIRHISPLQAKMTTDTVKVKRRRNKRNKNKRVSVWLLAQRELGQQKGKLFLIVLSFSLTIVFGTMIGTLMNSFKPEQAMENVVKTDFKVASNNFFRFEYGKSPQHVDEEVIDNIENLPEFTVGGKQYGQPTTYSSDTSKQQVNIVSDNSFQTILYGYEHLTYDDLELIDGKLPGNEREILEGIWVNSRGEMDSTSRNHDLNNQITLNIGDDAIDYTIVGHVKINESNTFDWTGSAFILPAKEYINMTGDSGVMGYVFNVKQGSELVVSAALDAMLKKEYIQMDYESKLTVLKSLDRFKVSVSLLGYALLIIFIIIGLLNMANWLMVYLNSKKREFHLMTIIGMTTNQINQLIYLVISLIGLSVLFLSAFISWIVLNYLVQPITQDIWFLTYSPSFNTFLCLGIISMMYMLILTYILKKVTLQSMQ